MQRPKWLTGWGKGKNLFEASLIIDIPDVKVVEASFDKKLLFFAMGTETQRDAPIFGDRNPEPTGEEHRSNFEWKIFYDSTTLPQSVPVDKAEEFFRGAVAMSAGSVSIYDANTKFIASGARPSKGNAPLLLDYELAKKIEAAKKQK